MSSIFPTALSSIEPRIYTFKPFYLKESLPLESIRTILDIDPLEKVFKTSLSLTLLPKKKSGMDRASQLFHSVQKTQTAKSTKHSLEKGDPSPKKKRRKIVPYSSNVTSATRASEKDLFEELPVQCSSQDLWANTYRGINLRERIQDHAFRRLSIFYYILLVYYKQDLDIELAPTLLQHGTTVCGKCHAAHSSILPNLKDNFYLQVIETINTQGVTKEVEEKLHTLSIPPLVIEEIKKNPTGEYALRTLNAHFSDTPSLLPKHSHLYHSMNATIELLRVANQYDSIIEKVLRPRALHLLNQVSKEGIHPYKALEDFTKELQEFFSHSQRQIKEKSTLLNQVAQEEEILRQKIEHYKRTPEHDKKERLQTTFNHLFNIKSLLRETQKWNGSSPSVDVKKIFQPYRALYSEIMERFTKEKEKVFALTESHALIAYIDQLLTKLPVPQQMLPDYKKETEMSALHAYLSTLFKRISPIEFLFTTSSIDSLIYQQLKLLEAPENQSLLSIQTRLKETKKIIDLQKIGTTLPKFALLSGKIVGGQLRPFTEEELLAQQRDIISKRAIVEE